MIKSFVVESLRFVTSKITGIEVNSLTPKLDYEETDSELLSRPGKKTLTLTNSIDTRSFHMLNETLIFRNLASSKVSRYICLAGVYRVTRQTSSFPFLLLPSSSLDSLINHLLSSSTVLSQKDPLEPDTPTILYEYTT